MTLAPWHRESWRDLAARRRDGQLAHALLLCGPRGLGKRAFAERLARALLCERWPHGMACARCRSCRLPCAAARTRSRGPSALAHPGGYAGHPASSSSTLPGTPRKEIIESSSNRYVRSASVVQDRAIRRHASRSARSGRRDECEPRQCVAQDARGTDRGDRDGAGRRSGVAPAGDDPQPLPAHRIPGPARGAGTRLARRSGRGGQARRAGAGSRAAAIPASRCHGCAMVAWRCARR